MPDLDPKTVKAAIIRSIRKSPVESARQDFRVDNLQVLSTTEPSFHRYARGHRQVAKQFDPE